MVKNICSFCLTTIILVLATCGARADATFDITPTSVELYGIVAWDDDVTLSSPDSVWTDAELYGQDLWMDSADPIDIQYPIDDQDSQYHGGELFITGITINELGNWNFHQINSGRDPSQNIWYWGSHDILVYCYYVY